MKPRSILICVYHLNLSSLFLFVIVLLFLGWAGFAIVHGHVNFEPHCQTSGMLVTGMLICN